MNANFDALVIGAGAGGAAAAWSLCKRKLKVLLIESGPRYSPASDYQLDETAWELKKFPDRSRQPSRYTFGELQRLEDTHRDLRSWNHINGHHNTSGRRQGFAYHHVKGVGGSTLHFTGEAHRLNPNGMKLHSQFGVGLDWPVSYETLEPFYREAENVLGVSGPDKVFGRLCAPPLPPHKLSFASQQIHRGANLLGLNWQPNFISAPSKPYRGRPDCNYCGGCNRGCQRGDKGSADLTFIKEANYSGLLTILTNHDVINLVPGASRRIEQVEISTPGQERQTISLNGRPVFLACGAIESPRLLLNSTNEFAPHGVGNANGRVGKNFMETLSWSCAGLHPENLASYRGHPSDSICWDFNAPDAIPNVVGGCRFSPSLAESDLIGPLNYALRVVPGIGASHLETMRKQFGRLLGIAAIGESIPNHRSYISLDPHVKDSYGRPVAKINSWLDEQAIQRLRFMARQSEEILIASGVNKIIEAYGSYDFFNSTHVFGTCVMGRDPKTSVVNEWCQSHEHPNLIITDASVFPSSGGGQAPSLTIQALAIRAVQNRFPIAGKQ